MCTSSSLMDQHNYQTGGETCLKPDLCSAFDTDTPNSRSYTLWPTLSVFLSVSWKPADQMLQYRRKEWGQRWAVKPLKRVVESPGHIFRSIGSGVRCQFLSLIVPVKRILHPHVVKSADHLRPQHCLRFCLFLHRYFTNISPAVAVFAVAFFFDSERRPLADPSLNVHSNTKGAWT